MFKKSEDAKVGSIVSVRLDKNKSYWPGKVLSKSNNHVKVNLFKGAAEAMVACQDIKDFKEDDYRLALLKQRSNKSLKMAVKMAISEKGVDLKSPLTYRKFLEQERSRKNQSMNLRNSNRITTDSQAQFDTSRSSKKFQSMSYSNSQLRSKNEISYQLNKTSKTNIHFEGYQSEIEKMLEKTFEYSETDLGGICSEPSYYAQQIYSHLLLFLDCFQIILHELTSNTKKLKDFLPQHSNEQLLSEISKKVSQILKAFSTSSNLSIKFCYQPLLQEYGQKFQNYSKKIKKGSQLSKEKVFEVIKALHSGIEQIKDEKNTKIQEIQARIQAEQDLLDF